MKIFAPKSIKYYVRRYIESNDNLLRGRTIIDLPAGSGYSAELLYNAGADVHAYDLFPEFFKFKKLQCQPADLEKTLPIEDDFADIVLFQEGIEHLPDQLHALREINRTLKPSGKLLLTTPNYSNLRAKLSYMLNESEQYKLMPPNQIESIWFSNKNDERARYYFGHIFLIGIQKLRLLGTLCGFRINKIHYTRVNITSAFLLFFLYPFILVSAYRAYHRALRKITNVPQETKKQVLKETLMLQINPKVLIDGHLFVEFEKICEPDEVAANIDIFNREESDNFET